MILDENLFQDYRKPLKESAEAVKRILQPRVTKRGIKPFGDNERLPRGFRFKSSSGTNGEVTYNGRDYIYAIKNGEVIVMDSSKAGHNWSETIYKESINESKSISESINLSEDQLDKAMGLVDEIYEACKSIYSYNENGKFEEGLNLNEWSIYSAAANLHDMLESGSLTESTETDETPWSYKEVEDTLKSLSNNWKDKDGTVRCYYKEEKDHAVKILRRHYKIVEVSQDGDWRVIAFATPIQKESMLEDYLREADYAEKASRLSLRDINSMLDLLDDVEDTDNKFSEYVNALKAEKAKKEKEAEYKNSRKFKRDELNLDKQYPYYITLYDAYPIYEPAEGGYYYDGYQAKWASGYETFKEAVAEISSVAQELNNAEGYNFVKKSAGEYEDYGDKYIGTGAVLRIENNKQFRSYEKGYQPYE